MGLKRTLRWVSIVAMAVSACSIVIETVALLGVRAGNEAVMSPPGTRASDGNFRVALAQAYRLSRTGRGMDALAAYKIISQDAPEEIRIAAQFNSANILLREAIRVSASGAPDAAAQAQPSIELAKRMYRDVLQIQPQHWDARYNLELALRLGPETAADAEDLSQHIVSVRSEREIKGAERGLP